MMRGLCIWETRYVLLNHMWFAIGGQRQLGGEQLSS